jgi:hypothetical protein
VFPVDSQIEQERNMIANWDGAPVIRNRNSHYTPHFSLQRPILSLAAKETFKTGETTWKTGGKLII